MSNLLGYTLQRSPIGSASSSLGAAISAGIGAGIWVNKEELQKHRKNVEYFEPMEKYRKQNAIKNKNFSSIETSDDSKNFEKYLKNTERDIVKWNKAIRRCMNWYDDENE